MTDAKAAEELLVTAEFRLTRNGRYLIAELLRPHRVLSTSFANGGQSENLKYLVNHQSCEGKDHTERYHLIHDLGQDTYHKVLSEECGVDPAVVAGMGTAANMNYAAVIQRHDGPVCVTAVVTAGVHANAACAGDPADWRETEKGWEKISPAPVAGTINTILLINQPLAEGALARAVVTMTEGKSAALQRLAVRSLYSQDFATGTGTDQYCVAAPLEGGRPLTSTSPHSKLGELIGAATRDATLEALRWQNGLEISTTRLIFHALGRYGVTETSLMQDIAPILSERELDLLKKNFNSVVYEPKVAAAAYAMAAVLDRIRCGTFPAGAARDIFRQYAATLATSLAAEPDQWLQFYERLASCDPENPSGGIVSAIAMGWSEKWR